MSSYEIRIYDPDFDLPFDQWDKEGFENYTPQKVYTASSMSELLSIWYWLESDFEGYPYIVMDIELNASIIGGIFVDDDIDYMEYYFEDKRKKNKTSISKKRRDTLIRMFNAKGTKKLSVVYDIDDIEVAREVLKYYISEYVL